MKKAEMATGFCGFAVPLTPAPLPPAGEGFHIWLADLPAGIEIRTVQATLAALRCNTKIGCAQCDSFFFLLVISVSSEGS